MIYMIQWMYIYLIQLNSSQIIPNNPPHIPPPFVDDDIEIWDDSDITEQVTEAFHVFDEDNSGAISSAELKHVMTNLGEKLTEKEIDTLFADGDVDGDGQIDSEEFIKLMIG
eukprot:1118251_1